MANSFKIPETAYDGFDALIRIGDEKLVQLVEQAEQKQLTLAVENLVAELAKAVEVHSEDLELALDNALIPLSGLRAEFRMPAEGFVDLLTHLITEQNPEWHHANRDGWRRVAPTVALLVGPNSLFTQLNKAYRLLVNRPSLVDNVRLLTELRPVYDDEVTAVKAYLITTTMAASYQEFGELKRVHLTFDRKDLERLQEQVDRALRKIALLERQVALLGVPSLVAGTERS